MRSSCDLSALLTLHRLEAATSRLEDIASSVDGASNVPAAGLTGAARGLDAPTSTSSVAAQSQTTITPVPEPQPAQQEPLPRQVELFDELIDSDVNAFVEAAAKVGGLVEQQVWALNSSRRKMLTQRRPKLCYRDIKQREHTSS